MTDQLDARAAAINAANRLRFTGAIVSFAGVDARILVGETESAVPLRDLATINAALEAPRPLDTYVVLIARATPTDSRKPYTNPQIREIDPAEIDLGAVLADAIKAGTVEISGVTPGGLPTYRRTDEQQPGGGGGAGEEAEPDRRIVTHARCATCGRIRPVNAQGLCFTCYQPGDRAAAAPEIDQQQAWMDEETAILGGGGGGGEDDQKDTDWPDWLMQPGSAEQDRYDELNLVGNPENTTPPDSFPNFTPYSYLKDIDENGDPDEEVEADDDRLRYGFDPDADDDPLPAWMLEEADDPMPCEDECVMCGKERCVNAEGYCSQCWQIWNS